ncbi:hypothetical protein BS47DRAFT_1334253 [Hydnum rufescens UP504]|uniref:UBC core domain-containing protein n=1 Tax=Hydnum rufescens UP504 TaxID=1448309 RepID=A0A9P6DLA3_9AGAM|nr:hypothetical protein BS47DRAFT_1334253 [Hydnum rufescens UP504]
MQASIPRPEPIKVTSGATSSVASGSVTKRLSNELMQLTMASTPGLSAFPKSDSNLFEWIATIDGPPETYYAGQRFKLSINFPETYPYVAPAVVFISPCFHPNVALPGGQICLDILKEKWSAIYSVHTILLSIQSLLGEPNNDSPLNTEAAELWTDKKGFVEQLKRYAL